ncbi:mechanosensitive ion channel family protein [Agromyces sp. MMS24-K17]|uniref:mechanosensitive ion channel family protein n=1 Tax=Agromyces sp. MMS24-K17 TaxID=3372850 RepID=UPI003754A32A
MPEWIASLQINGWTLLLAALSVLAGWLLGRLARKGARTLLDRVPSVGEPVKLTVMRIVEYTIVLLGIVVGLSFLGASVEPLIAVAIIIGVVLALVLRGVADNFAAGVVLQSRRPIDVGDLVRSQGIEGEVIELNGRAVVVRTFDGMEVHLPNADVLGSPIVNESTHGALRSELEVRVALGGGADVPARVRTRLLEAAAAVEGVLAEPAPIVSTATRAPGRAIYRVRVWHLPNAGLGVRSAAVDALADALAADGLDAVVTSDRPSAPLTSPDAI